MKRASHTGIAASMLAFMVSAVTATAQIIYQQNFDAVGQAGLINPGPNGAVSISSILPGWSVSLNSTGVANTTVNTGVHSTLTPGSYLASGDQSDFDFEIYSYQGPGTHTDSINFTFTNTGSSALSGIVGSFDFEAAWSKATATQASGQTAGFDNGLTYSINGGSAVSLPGTVTSVTNAGVNGTTVPSMKWLTDAQMNTAGLSIRNIGFDLGSVVLNPGDTIELTWSNVGTATGRTIAFGLDNFVLGDNDSLMVPEPSTWVAVSLAMLVLTVQVVRAHSFSKRREPGARS